jgi:hypothetical protein
LRKNGVIHFDAHFYNVLTDEEQAYLADFGLALDRSFALTKEEERFFRQHIDYDYGEVLACLDFLVLRSYDALPERAKCRVKDKYGIDESTPHEERLPVFLNNIEAIHNDRVMKLDKEYVATIVRYRGIIALMHKFYSDLGRNNQKDTKFPHAKLRRLLQEAQLVPGAGSST